MKGSDTTAAAHAAQIAIYQRMGPVRRVELAVAMSEDARAVALAGIRARHPGSPEAQALRELHRRILGEDLAARAWPAGDEP